MRVLLVEDESGSAQTVRRGLVAEGFVVDIEHDGVDGLAAACAGDFDVIVLDIMLPGLNGYQVLREMRARQVWTPVLMLTAKDGEYDQADAFDLGADDYMTKPFSFVVLVARLRALVRRGAPAPPDRPDCGQPDAGSVPAPGDSRARPDRLTPREYGVLEFLMRNKGDVVTKAEILRTVWDANYEGDDNVVEVYVGYLRRKIDAPFGVAPSRLCAVSATASWATLTSDPLAESCCPSGSVRAKLAPPSTASATVTVPWWDRTISATIDKPRPDPPDERVRAGSRRTNRSKMRARSWCGIPVHRRRR